MEKQKTGGNAQQLKKGLLVALLLGVATAYLREATMVVVDLYYAVAHGWWRSLGDSWLVLVEIAAAVCAILFLKKNSKVSLGLLAAWAVLMVIRLQPARLLPNMYSLTNALTSVPEVLLMVLTVYGLNKAEKRLSIPASAVLVLWTIAAVVVDGGRSHYYHGAWFGGDSIYSAIFLWAGIYSRLLPPILLLICALKPGCIRNSVKVLSGYMAVVLMLFIAGDLLELFVNGRASMEHLSVPFLLEVCLPPVMLIFGLNAVLLFPVPFRELAKVFGMSLLIVGYIAAASAAQQADQQAKERAEEQRQEHMEKMRDNILSWEKAGFGETFSMEAAKDMLHEGRITYDEYQWLVQELLTKG